MRRRGLAAEDAGLVDRLLAFSEGNALFLNQAIADVLERDATVDAAPERPVRGIANLIASRIARLSDAARAVAEIAAACGEGCNVDVVRDVAGLKAGETLDAFDELSGPRTGPRSERARPVRLRFHAQSHRALDLSAHGSRARACAAMRASLTLSNGKRFSRRATCENSVGITKVPNAPERRADGTSGPRARPPRSTRTTIRSG